MRRYLLIGQVGAGRSHAYRRWCRGAPIGGLVALALLACADDTSHQTGGLRFSAQVGGVVLDRSTKLEWTARDSRTEMSWQAAVRHCRSQSLAGVSDWRLPTIDELAGLYDARSTTPCGGSEVCHLAAPVELTSPYQWSQSEPDPARRFYIDFRFGTRLAPRLRPDLTRHALCVRSP